MIVEDRDQTTPAPAPVAGTTATSLADALLTGDPGAEVLAGLRPDVVTHTREAWAALYDASQPLSGSYLHSIALDVARRQGGAALADLHREHLGSGEPPADSPVESALRTHAARVTVAPALVTDEDLTRLVAAGATPRQIVLVAQVVAFESHLLRLLHGLATLRGVGVSAALLQEQDLDDFGRRTPKTGPTITGRRRPEAFTRDELDWEPWIAAPSPEDLTEEQRASFAAKSSSLDSVYFRLISLTPAVTRARSALDNAIFLPRDGLPKAERELAAAVSSRINDCVFCASVHARKSAQLSKRTENVDRVLAAAVRRGDLWQVRSTTSLAEGLEERWAAIVEASAALALLRPNFTQTHVDRLRGLGVEDTEVLDVVAATAFFAWANRLMLTLGEPSVRDSAAA